MFIGWYFPILLAAVLELLVIYYLARGPRKRFPFVFAFCAIQILFLVVDTVCSALIGERSPVYGGVYWAGDLIAHGAISLLILSLIWQSFDLPQSRRKIAVLLGLATVCFALSSVYIFHAPNFSRWMTAVSRNLSFGEEVLNMMLWAILIQRHSDYLLLMVSAGIGVQVTGEAIGHTLRLYTHSRSAVWVPNLLVQLAEILCLAIWIWAFRSARTKQSPARTASRETDASQTPA